MVKNDHNNIAGETIVKKVLLVGLGLIGGSIALAIKQAHSVHVIGCDVNEREGEMGVSLGVIDSYTKDLQEAAEAADYIFLATPIYAICEILQKLAAYHLKENVIISDTGSTKVEILKAAKSLLDKGICFIGGHPMAGSHKTGVTAARAHLFENAFYIFTPTERTTKEQLEDLQSLLAGTGARFQVIDAPEHDQLTGMISHFPHVIAAGIVRQTERFAQSHPFTQRLAAGGFKDITRIASSSPDVWLDIIQSNRENVIRMLDQWSSEMQMIKQLIAQNDSKGIHSYFQEARIFRDSLPQKGAGAIPSFYDLYVDIVDRPGAIAHVTGLIESLGISITNIRIIEAREEIFGILRISFQNEADRETVQEVLNKARYESKIPT